MNQTRRSFLQLLATVAVTAPFAGTLKLIPVVENTGWFQLEKYLQYRRTIYTLGCCGATPAGDVYHLDYNREVQIPLPYDLGDATLEQVFEQQLENSIQVLHRDLIEHGVRLITVPPLDHITTADERRLIKVDLPNSIVFMQHPDAHYYEAPLDPQTEADDVRP